MQPANQQVSYSSNQPTDYSSSNKGAILATNQQPRLNRPPDKTAEQQNSGRTRPSYEANDQQNKQHAGKRTFRDQQTQPTPQNIRPPNGQCQQSTDQLSNQRTNKQPINVQTNKPSHQTNQSSSNQPMIDQPRIHPNQSTQPTTYKRKQATDQLNN